MIEEKSSAEQQIPGEIFCNETLFPVHDKSGDDLLMQIDPLQVYKATSDPDSMYLHQAMKEPDQAKFLSAMLKEVRDQMENGNFSIIKRKDVPKGSTILPCVWQMKQKRDIKSREIKKWKARLTVDGSRMKRGQHYDKVYAPVASWGTIRFLMVFVTLNNWTTKQINYVQAFLQAPAEKDLYLKVLAGFDIKDGNKEDYALKLHKNVYGQKQAGRVWYKFLTNKLTQQLGFKQSKVDECLFYRGKHSLSFTLTTQFWLVQIPKRLSKSSRN